MLVDVGSSRKWCTERLLPVIVTADARQRIGKLIGGLAEITGGLIPGQHNRGDAFLIARYRLNAVDQTGRVRNGCLITRIGFGVSDVCQTDAAQNGQPGNHAGQQGIPPPQNLFKIPVQVLTAVKQFHSHNKEKPGGQIGEGHQSVYPTRYNANHIHGQRQAGNVSHQQKQPQRALPQTLFHQQPDDQHGRQRRAQQEQRVHDPLAVKVCDESARQKKVKHLRNGRNNIV